MQTRFRLIALLFAVVSCCTIVVVNTPLAHAQDKSLIWERFDVDITVNADSTIDVAEHQNIRFTSGAFTFGYRDIPRNNLDFIDNWQIYRRWRQCLYPILWRILLHLHCR